jgi:hypothetical protein
MADEPKKPDAFRAQDPHIPGVTDNPKREKEAEKLRKLAEKAQRGSSSSSPALSPALLGIIVGIVAVVGLAYFGVKWWETQRALKQAENPPVAAGTTDLPPTNVTVADLPFGPGPVATTAELSKEWSSKRFIFRAPQTADNIPAVVIKLPNNVYWGLSLREPFGTCEMEYVTDTEKISAVYRFQADHPMIGDPCTKAVFDLLKYGNAPGGVVRGETVSGAASRPPVAIQMVVKGKDVVAVKIEE